LQVGPKGPGQTVKTFYTRRASKRLNKLLALASQDERTSLAQEVDLARVMCERNIRIYDKVVLENAGSAKLKAKATQGLKEALRFVQESVRAHSASLAVSNTVVPVEHLAQVRQQFLKALEDVLLPTHEDLYEMLSDRLEQLAVSPNGEAQKSKTIILQV
jgi:hypothetical protein